MGARIAGMFRLLWPQFLWKRKAESSPRSNAHRSTSMLNATLTVKNFRCFEDTNPCRIDLKPGFTALVGPNNSGKSSLLRMFYELRDLFVQLQSTDNLLNVFHGGALQFQYREVPDSTSIFTDGNTRPLTIEFDFPHSPDGTQATSLELVIARGSNLCGVRIKLGSTFLAPNANVVVADQERGVLSVGGTIVDLSRVKQIGSTLANTMYLGAFRNALNLGAASYYDLTIGTGFISTWDHAKYGEHRAGAEAIIRVQEAIRHLFGFRSLDISASPDNQKLRVFVNGKPFDIREQGAGLTQFVLSLGNVAIKQPDLILIDEPESNLHPSLQIDFLLSLGSFAKQGVLFSTHSIGLARSVAETTYSLQKPETHSIVRRLERTPNYTEFAGELSFSTFRDLGYDRILLVEGPTDVCTVQQLLRKLNKDHKIVVLQLGGDAMVCGGRDQELGELTRITGPERIAALVDSERDTAGGPSKKAREDFEASGRKLGFTVQLTDRRAIENYFPDHAVKAGVGENFEALGHYERRGSAVGKDWSKNLNWKIASEMTLDDLLGTDLLRFLDAL